MKILTLIELNTDSVFLIQGDHWSPKLSFITLGVVEALNMIIVNVIPSVTVLYYLYIYEFAQY